MDISIIVPTLGNIELLNNFLNSVTFTQPIDNFEILIINQGDPILINNFSIADNKILNNIKIYNVEFRGLSKAKNYGALNASYRIIFFVDDDAELFDNTLNIASSFFENSNLDVLFGRVTDKDGNNTVINFSNEESYLDVKKFEGKFIESAMFIKRDIILKYPFDENLGAGCFFGAEEGYDVVYRMLIDSVPIYYSPLLVVYHPNKTVNYQSKAAFNRVFFYRTGFAYICRKHSLNKKILSRLFLLICSIPVFVLIMPKKLNYYILEITAIIVGYIMSKNFIEKKHE